MTVKAAPQDKAAPEYLLEDFDLTLPGGRIDLVLHPANGESPVAIFKTSVVENDDGTFSTTKNVISAEVAAGLACAQFVTKALSVSGRLREQLLSILPKFIGGLNQMGELMAGMMNDVDVVLDEGTMDALIRAELVTMAAGLMSVADGRDPVMRSVIPEVLAAATEKRGAVMSRARRNRFEKIFRDMVDFAKDAGLDIETLFAPKTTSKSAEVAADTKALKEYVVKTHARLEKIDKRMADLEKGIDIKAIVMEEMRKMVTPGGGTFPDDDLDPHKARNDVVGAADKTASSYAM